MGSSPSQASKARPSGTRGPSFLPWWLPPLLDKRTVALDKPGHFNKAQVGVCKQRCQLSPGSDLSG